MRRWKVLRCVKWKLKKAKNAKMIQVIKKHKGLGDTVEFLAEKTGIAYVVKKAVEFGIIEDCKCGENRRVNLFGRCTRVFDQAFPMHWPMIDFHHCFQTTKHPRRSSNLNWGQFYVDRPLGLPTCNDFRPC